MINTRIGVPFFSVFGCREESEPKKINQIDILRGAFPIENGCGEIRVHVA